MKKMQAFVLMLALTLMGFSAALRADDTDIYVDNAGTAGVPNVLFVMDTGANFSSNAAVPCTAYGSGGAPSLGGTAGGVEQCALVDALEALPNGTVNIGILVNNNNSFATDTRAAGDAAFHETCMGTYGGCVIRKLALMNTANKASLVNFIKSWKTSGSNSATEFNVKSGGDRTANTMQEAWAYYHGKVGMSGKNYADSVLASGCQKNFVIFIGNAFNTSGGPADGGAESPFNGANALTSTQVGATAAQKLKISETVNFLSPTCGVSSSAPSTNASNWSENWADEWARLMFQQDGGATTADGAQNIITYTIGVVNDAQCKADYPALLSTMAKYGGGKYFKTSNAAEVKVALDTILNEVQAVNSVFSSASLPVSVNAEGSYLNQIFLGMFRPDSSGAPRWVGNLKQYQLIRSSSGSLVLGDANNNAAISSAGTGFITPNAVSFWTYKNTATAPDDAATGGMFKNDPKGTPATVYDSPDGEVVEKGGAAQQQRKESLTADFAAASGGANNPRRLYTYCPSGSSCNPLLSHSSNDFSLANTAIGTTAFGNSVAVPIASIVRDRTTATVTTSSDHNFTNTNTVVISGATQTAYNVTQLVSVIGSRTFMISGLSDFPTSPSTGAYSINTPLVGSVGIVSIVRATSTTSTSNSAVATVTTAVNHGYTTLSNVSVSGASPAAYNYSGAPGSVPSTTAFTFDVAIEPPATAVNVYQATFSPTAYPSRSVSLSRASANTIGGSTGAAHGFHVGQTVVISGATADPTKYNGTWTVATVPTATSFTISASGLGNPANATGSVVPSSAAQTIALTRTGTTVNATATASGAPANFFGSSVNATRILNISKLSGSANNESAYVQSNVTVTCTNASCTSFTYPVTVTPATAATGVMSVSLNAGSANVAAGAITRVGSTATVSGLVSNVFTNGQTVTIAFNGSALSSEEAYVGTWQVNCTVPCTSFTFGPVTQTPATPATGVNMQAFSAQASPDRTSVMRWVRGADIQADEKGPGNGVTVRPSIHGDVLHSRPVVINYGDTRGIVVFYGGNDGVYRAVNGGQTTAIGSVPAGGELWGLILPEHYNDLNRQRINFPELKFPSTTLATAQPKDYFIDGPTGVFQQIDGNGLVTKAILYLTMRRGGRFIYAIDVTTPTAPTVLWRKSNNDTGFEELGQTWSRPKLTLVQGSTTAVLAFGGGYDPAEDQEPPGTNGMGRAVYVVNALTGDLIWSASPVCITSATCLNVPGLTHAVPSEIQFVDRDTDGKADKFYFGDVGGNVWRVDVDATSTSNWRVTKLAALGCDTGVCAAGTNPRKFFYPPAVLTVLPAGASGSYDAISLPSGDREHPLKSSASFGVVNRFFLLKDTATAVGSTVTSTITLPDLVNATSFSGTTTYDGSGKGFYITFATGEKAVNAPLAAGGQVFFATNRPVDSSTTCSANLGEAKAYAISPFDGTKVTNVLPGGGMPPSAVTGIINIDVKDANGNVVGSSRERFCIGCGVTTSDGAAPCNSALENCSNLTSIPRNLRRSYWYKK